MTECETCQALPHPIHTSCSLIHEERTLRRQRLIDQQLNMAEWMAEDKEAFERRNLALMGTEDIRCGLLT